MSPLENSKRILAYAMEAFSPTHIVSMVSGGRDSAASHQVAQELGVKVDFVMHGNTRCGIPETTQFVRETYGRMGEYVEADAGAAYEDYVLRKGFFGKGHDAHGFAYRVLKAAPFRAAISKHLRKGKRDVRVLLLNGARKDESENRQKRLKISPVGKRRLILWQKRCVVQASACAVHSSPRRSSLKQLCCIRTGAHA